MHDPPIGTGFKQQGYVEGDQATAAAAGILQKAAFLPVHQRMENALQSLQRSIVAEHVSGKTGPIDASVNYHIREGFLDQRYGTAAFGQQPVHRDVGIMGRDAEPPQMAGRGALAHADRAGQSKDDHGPMTNWRKLSVTSGITPNHAAKPGLA